MPIVRWILIFFLAASVGLLVWQNLSPSVPLVFLGAPLGSLPLSLWLVLALALGAGTTLLLSVLVQWAGPRSSQPPQAPVGDRFRDRFRDSWFERFTRRSQVAKTPTQEVWDDDDWGSSSRDDRRDDWGDEPRVDRTQASPSDPTIRQPVRQEIVDAEFRVIVPPSRNLDDDNSNSTP